ncbi:MAG: flagellar protein FliS [Holosporales bacterium]
MYNQINRYVQLQQTTQSGQRAVSILLRRASSALHEAEIAIEKGDIEKRVKMSGIASDLLFGLSNIFREASAQGDAKAQELAEYFDAMVDLINRMNFHNEARTAQALADNLARCALEWDKNSQSQKAAPTLQGQKMQDLNALVV